MAGGLQGKALRKYRIDLVRIGHGNVLYSCGLNATLATFGYWLRDAGGQQHYLAHIRPSMQQDYKDLRSR